MNGGKTSKLISENSLHNFDIFLFLFVSFCFFLFLDLVDLCKILSICTSFMADAFSFIPVLFTEASVKESGKHTEL